MNVLIVEDEMKTANLLKDLVESQPGFSVINLLDSIESSVQYLRAHQSEVDLLFLDIQLADGQSFKIFELVEVKIPVIFCTAYDEYVMQAFKNNGIDYILKPFEENDIFKALAKFDKLKESFTKDLTDISSKLQSLFQGEKTHQKTMIVHVGSKMIPVDVSKIQLFHLENEAVKIYHSNNEKYVVFKRLDEIQSIIDEKLFFRINRQMIINRNAVKEIEEYFNRKVIIKTAIPIEEKIIVSRLKVTPFLSWLENPA
jgi:DNA-binding LytR/AlgR family response regulator